ncbi:MAG: hypothetical protein AAGG44_09905 [Planctomycetota bacterium]
MRNVLAKDSSHLRLALMTFLICSVVGCSPPPSSAEADIDSKKVTAADPIAAKSAHDHAHGHGPNGGSLVHLEPSGVHAEWKYDQDNARFTAFLGDFDEDKLTAAKLVPNAEGQAGENGNAVELAPGESGWSAQGDELEQLFSAQTKLQLIVTDDEGDHTCELTLDGNHDH